MLYIIPTPIGNLSDITVRAIEQLQECDLILCEDTRRSAILMRHYKISTPLKSYHQFNEKKLEKGILNSLKEGKKIALISDAGTPAIADPGQALVKRCREEKIPVTALPGASAAITALSGSGLCSDKFQFLGFLPKTRSRLQKFLETIRRYEGSSICYDSPNRILNTLAVLEELYPSREVAVARELTKSFEEYLVGTPEEVGKAFEGRSVKGEVVLIIGPSVEDLPAEDPHNLLEDAAALQDKFSLSRKDAVGIVAFLKGVPRKELYKLFNS